MQYEQFGSQQNLVAAAGTAVPIGETEAIGAVIVKALPTNVGFIYLGGPDVSDSNGYMLDAGETVSVDAKDLAYLYMDAGTNDDGVCLLYKK